MASHFVLSRFLPRSLLPTPLCHAHTHHHGSDIRRLETAEVAEMAETAPAAAAATTAATALPPPPHTSPPAPPPRTKATNFHRRLVLAVFWRRRLFVCRFSAGDREVGGVGVRFGQFTVAAISLSAESRSIHATKYHSKGHIDNSDVAETHAISYALSWAIANAELPCLEFVIRTDCLKDLFSLVRLHNAARYTEGLVGYGYEFEEAIIWKLERLNQLGKAVRFERIKAHREEGRHDAEGDRIADWWSDQNAVHVDEGIWP
ncbi:hypothetical protein CERZMDRAFT_89206 [Cercospora zeae-maydis SCOH1-5]|uniref:Uncharacterized protein n=1 Tax=Cercospora zeae-maydis SCOH1-5 TaxID=717836 RepID=A0A6A6F071_9PEZI|nr:hypothetical protein CERZMDRAFT_89206 [Cercospora zeae-maydis SCOH1-5]